MNAQTRHGKAGPPDELDEILDAVLKMSDLEVRTFAAILLWLEQEEACGGEARALAALEGLQAVLLRPPSDAKN